MKRKQIVVQSDITEKLLQMLLQKYNFDFRNIGKRLLLKMNCPERLLLTLTSRKSRLGLKRFPP